MSVFNCLIMSACCVASTLSSLAQTSEVIANYKKAVAEHDYKKALTIAQEANKTNGHWVKNVTKNYLILGKKKKGLDVLAKSLIDFEEARTFLKDSVYQAHITVQDWDYYQKERIKYTSKRYRKTKNIALSIELREMAMEDQTLRKLSIDYENRGLKEHEKEVTKSIIKSDSLHSIRLQEIVRQFGVPEDSDNGYFWLLLLHTSVDTINDDQEFEYYAPYLAQAIRKHPYNAVSYSFYVDRRENWKKGHDQCYGTLAEVDSVTQKMTIQNIADPEHVNERRKAIGLGTIEEFAKLRGYELPKNYIRKP